MQAARHAWIHPQSIDQLAFFRLSPPLPRHPGASLVNAIRPLEPSERSIAY